MATVVRMPSVLAGATEAAIAHWLVVPGDTVAPGTPIAELETEKALVEYAAEEAGVVGRLVLGEGDSGEVGDPIAVLVAAGETDADIDAALSGRGPGTAPGQRTGAEPGAGADAAVTGSALAAPGTNGHQVAAHPAAGHGGRVFASPLVRKLASERGIDLAALAGTGPNGRIVRRDLERYLAGAAPAAQTTATTDGGGAAATAAASTLPASTVPANTVPANTVPAGTAVAGTATADTVSAGAGADGAGAAGTAVSGRAAPASPPSPLPGGTAGGEERRAPVPLHASGAARTAGGGTAPAGAGLIPHTPMRRAIARRLTESKATVPHFYLVAEPVVDELLALRQRVNEALSAGTVSAGTVPAGTMSANTGPPTTGPANTGPVKVSVNDFVIAAAAAAFGDVPEANVTWSDDGLVTYRSVDISIAVATEGGLVTPVLRGAEGKKLSAIARESAALARRARDRQLRQHELEGGTFTVSNLGMYGTAEFSAIINPPQSGIIAVGAARLQPVVAGGAVVAATVMRCTLSVDHRAIDGALAARWLAAFTARLENPLGLLA